MRDFTFKDDDSNDPLQGRNKIGVSRSTIRGCGQSGRLPYRPKKTVLRTVDSFKVHERSSKLMELDRSSSGMRFLLTDRNLFSNIFNE